MGTLAVDSIALPLDNEQTTALHKAVAGLSPAQLQWVSGYVAGLAASGSVPVVADSAAVEVAATPDKVLTILYGSQTGNGEGIATALAESAKAKGYATKVHSMANFKPSALKRETLAAFVVSTHGEGDPPDDAELFHEFILSAKAPKLENLHYSVLALGDSSYVNFCQTGRELDARLAELGAHRLEPVVECDLDYEQAAGAWSGTMLEKLPDLLQAGAAVPKLRAVASVASYDKHRPFRAEVISNQKITGSGSTKDVRHLELSLEGSGIRYEPGDSLAVIVENPPQLVDLFLDKLGSDGSELVTIDSREVPIAEALQKDFEITATSLGFLRAWAEISQSAELEWLLQPEQQPALVEFVDSHQIIDVLEKYPAAVGAREFAANLRKLSPRSYSIASSLAANPEEVHLTVAVVRYDAWGREHWGAGSTHLADRVAEGQSVAVFVEPNSRFRLPADETSIIMIGPGTGVAPFRAFVEERAERGAAGKNWLFFGDRNFSSDFLYQLEWQRHLERGNLDRMDVAFSRDQKDKVYVQHRIRERARDIFAWLEEGASIYVCGDAKHMAGDVDSAMVDVIASQADIGREDAVARLKELRRAGRYQRDVY